MDATPSLPDGASDTGTSSERERRIRAALGLSAGSLPRVTGRWLQHYYQHLAASLCLPFEAHYADDSRPFQLVASAVTVLALIAPAPSPEPEHTSLYCRVRRGGHEVDLPLVDLEVGNDSPNYQLLEDYWYWFWNWRFDPRI